MAYMLLDTEKMVERLEDAGVPPAQARAHIIVLAEAIHAVEAAIIERCASKQDLAELRAEMSAGFRRLETRMDIGFAGIDARFAGTDTSLAGIDTRFAHVDTQFARVETRSAQLEARIAEVKSELVRWVVTVGILQTAVIAGLLLKLAP